MRSRIFKPSATPCAAAHEPRTTNRKDKALSDKIKAIVIGTGNVGGVAVPLADPAMRMSLYVLSNPSQDKAARVREFVAYVAMELRSME